jgi:hypothetical protein
MPIPRLRAWALPDKIHWVVWCEHCARYHRHGAAPGYRVQHCGDRTVDIVDDRLVVRSRPYWTDGYILVGGEPAPHWLLADVQNSAPLGPARAVVTPVKHGGRWV